MNKETDEDRLVEKARVINGEIFNKEYNFNESLYICNVCGIIFNLEKEMIRLDFSFCDEYDCGINICEGCLKNLKSKFNKKKRDE